MPCSLPALHALLSFPCSQLCSLHLGKTSIKRHKLLRRPENHRDLGDGRWTGLEKCITDRSLRHSQAASFHMEAGHGKGENGLRQGIPQGPWCRRGISFHCYHCHWGKKKNRFMSLFPKCFPVSQIFGHLWRKRQFSGISRDLSGLY